MNTRGIRGIQDMSGAPTRAQAQFGALRERAKAGNPSALRELYRMMGGSRGMGGAGVVGWAKGNAPLALKASGIEQELIADAQAGGEGTAR